MSNAITVEKMASWKALYDARGPRALIEATSGRTEHPWAGRLWAAAMTEAYGPCGLHADWTNADGSPSAEALEKLPGLAFQLEEARASIAGVWTFMSNPAHPWFEK